MGNRSLAVGSSWLGRFLRRGWVLALCASLAAHAEPLPEAEQLLAKADYASAYAVLLPLARDGEARAQFLLGDMYDRGLFVEASAEQAALWYRKAADLGDIESAFRLGALFEAGRGVENDALWAFAWYSRAALAGHLGALDALTRMRTRLEKQQARVAAVAEARGEAGANVEESARLLAMLSAREEEHARTLAAAEAKWRSDQRKQLAQHDQTWQAHLQAAVRQAREETRAADLSAQRDSLAREAMGQIRREVADALRAEIEAQVVVARGGAAEPEASAPDPQARLLQQAREVLTPLGNEAMASFEQGMRALDAGDPETARARLLPAAMAGAHLAQWQVGRLLATGQGGARDPTEAIRWYEAAAQGGVNEARRELIRLHEQGEGVAQDLAVVARWREALAVDGDPVAQRELGLMYREGRGVTQDLARAAAWLRLAADRGDAEGQYLLGRVYDEGGSGVPRYLPEALDWYAKAAAQAHLPAMLRLAEIHDREPEHRDAAAARRWYEEAARLGNPAARQRLLALAEERSDDPILLRQAVVLLRESADAGDVAAQYALATRLLRGQGVAHNPPEAARWLHKAAGAGHAEAQAELGIAFLQGVGVPVDEVRAYRLLNLAASAGVERAQRQRGLLQRRLTSEQVAAAITMTP